MIWLNFAAFMFVFYNTASWCGYVHGILGILIVLLAFFNRKTIASTTCPPRIKRIAKASVSMSVAAALSGIALASPLDPLALTIFKAIHITVAMALFAQSASVATSFDMWGTKEFGEGPVLH
jgi:hypothetical protein